MQKITLAMARASCGLSQAELAEKVGVSRLTLQKWEKGKTDMRVKHLQKISEITGISMDDFFIPEKYA